MGKLKSMFNIFNDICLSICGLSLIEVVGSGSWNFDFFLKNIDESIKVTAAIVALIVLVITTPFRYKILKADLERKKIDNQIREIEMKREKEELKKLELENSIKEKDVQVK